MDWCDRWVSECEWTILWNKTQVLRKGTKVQWSKCIHIIVCYAHNNKRPVLNWSWCMWEIWQKKVVVYFLLQNTHTHTINKYCTHNLTHDTHKHYCPSKWTRLVHNDSTEGEFGSWRTTFHLVFFLSDIRYIRSDTCITCMCTSGCNKFFMLWVQVQQ